ncbi:MAG: hypothetical protein AAGU32_12835 [Bacillota bacterium]
MADYAFYTGTYLGGSIPEADFPRLAQRAQEQLARYKRIYTVTSPGANSEDMAVCAMADALYYYEMAQNGGLVTSSAIGSVSSSQKTEGVDISPKAQSKELYRCACLYLDIYRGVG